MDGKVGFDICGPTSSKIIQNPINKGVRKNDNVRKHFSLRKKICTDAGGYPSAILPDLLKIQEEINKYHKNNNLSRIDATELVVSKRTDETTCEYYKGSLGYSPDYEYKADAEGVDVCVYSQEVPVKVSWDKISELSKMNEEELQDFKDKLEYGESESKYEGK